MKASKSAPGTATRWVDARDARTDEGLAGALLRDAIVPEALSDARLAAVRARLGEKRRGPRRSWAFQLAFVLLIMLGLSTLVVAATQVKRWIVERAARRAEVTAPRAPVATVKHRRPRAAPEAPSAEALALPAPEALGPALGPPVPPPAPPARATLALNEPHAPARARREEHVAPPPPAETPQPPAEAPPPPASELAQESALLGRALQALRQDDDAEGALALFDQHAARFPAGSLGVEERIGRVEALLRLKRRGEALALLDPMTLPSKGKRRDMLVTRGELRARANRCAEALIDFGVALTSETRDDDAAERALYGRATCRARLGDTDGARADLERYLSTFPEGRFAKEARGTLRP